MARAETGGYRVEVVPAMRRSILPGSDWRALPGARAAVRRPAAGRRPHPQQQGRHPRPIRRPARRACPWSSTRSTGWRSRRAPGRRSTRSTSSPSGRRRKGATASCASPTRWPTPRSRRGSARRGSTSPSTAAWRRRRSSTRPCPATRPASRSACCRTTSRVGTIARLFDLKGHDDLIALAPALVPRPPRPALPVGRRRVAPAATRISNLGFGIAGPLHPRRPRPAVSRAGTRGRDGRARPPVAPRGPGPRPAAGVARRLPGRGVRHRRQPRGDRRGRDRPRRPAVRRRPPRPPRRRPRRRPRPPPGDGRGGAGVRARAVRRPGDGRRAGARLRRRGWRDGGEGRPDCDPTRRPTRRRVKSARRARPPRPLPVSTGRGSGR